PQHLRQTQAWAPLLVLRIVRLDHRNQARPRHHLLHLGQEFLASRALLLQSKFGFCKGDLLHSLTPFSAVLIVAASHASRIMRAAFFSVSLMPHHGSTPNR